MKIFKIKVKNNILENKNSQIKTINVIQMTILIIITRDKIQTVNENMNSKILNNKI